MNTTRPYPGSELAVFEHAYNWKMYWARVIRRYVRGDVLEVGAGLGVNHDYFDLSACSSWTFLEPDLDLASQISARINPLHLPKCNVRVGTTQDLGDGVFDCILYIDVLEHIEDDKLELQSATRHLRENGSIVVLAPAHNFLYTPFDHAIGHFRRYDRVQLMSCTPDSCKLETVFYLDSVGLLASLGNRILLKQAVPSIRQIIIWDRILVPLSRVVDAVSRRRFGKSVVAIWRKSASRK